MTPNLKRIIYQTDKSVWVSEEFVKEGDKYFLNGAILDCYSDEFKGRKENVIHATTGFKLGNLPMIELPMELDKTLEKLLREYSDKLNQERKNWNVGQHVGMPQTSKEINAQVQGFEDGYQQSSKMFSEADMLKFAMYNYKTQITHPEFTTADNFETFTQSLKPRPNSEIIGCELVMKDNGTFYDLDAEERYEPKTYLSPSNETFYEVKEFIYKR